MFKPALRIIFGRMIGFAVAFAIPIVLVRLFDLETFGTYKQWFLLYFTIVTISQIGMSESLLYFLPRAGRDAGEYMMNAFVFLALVGLVVAGALTVLREPIAAWMSNPALAPLIPPLAVYLFLMQAAISLETVMTARGQYALASAAYAGTDILRSAFFLLPLLVIPALPSLIYGAVAFGVLRLGVSLWYYRHEFGAMLRPNMRILAGQLAYALPFALYVVASVAQENVHQYAVAGLFDAATFAIYSVGCLQVPLVDVVSTTVCNVMMVNMAKEVQQGRDAQVLRLWHETVRKLALVFFPLVGVLLLGARDVIVLLFTESYLASVPIFMIGVLSILLASVPIDGLLRVYAKTQTLLIINLVRLGIIGALIYGFIMLFGLTGAVLVTVASLAIGKAIGLWSIMIQWGVRTAQVLPWRALGAIGLAALVAALPALAVNYSLHTTPWIRLCAAGSVYMAGYVSMVMALNVLHEDERTWLWSWADRTMVSLRSVS